MCSLLESAAVFGGFSYLDLKVMKVNSKGKEGAKKEWMKLVVFNNVPLYFDLKWN
jgi:hypothetical protein